jgi:ribose transport system permease protein
MTERLPFWRAIDLRGAVPVLTLIALVIFASVATEHFLSPLNLSNILVQSAIIAIVAMGMTFVIIGGGFDLSVGSTVALSGCITAWIMIDYGIFAGLLAGIGVGMVVGLFNGVVIGVIGVNPFITTLGTLVLVRGLVFLFTGGAPIDGVPREFVLFGRERILGINQLVYVPVILLAVLSWVMHATVYGRWIYATGGGREAAYLSGVPVRFVTVSTYVWSGGLAGVAGVLLVSRLQSGQPTAGELYELTAIAAVVLGGAALHGGVGTLWRTIVGVLILIVIGNSLNLLGVDSYWQRVAEGSIIIAAAAIAVNRGRRAR